MLPDPATALLTHTAISRASAGRDPTQRRAGASRLTSWCAAPIPEIGRNAASRTALTPMSASAAWEHTAAGTPLEGGDAMSRALFKMILGLAVALGLTFAAAPIAGATATTGVTTQAAATPDCRTQEAANAKANANYNKANADVAKAKAKVAKLKKKLKKAQRAHHAKQVKKLKKRLKKAKKSLKAKRSYRDRSAVTRSYTADALARCKAGTPATGSASPIQALCDAGLPQALCDALAGLIPGGSTANPADLLCAQVPQAKPLCDALNGGLPGGAPTTPQDLLDIVRGLLTTLGLGGLVDQLGLTGVIDQTGLQVLLDKLGLTHVL
jgi:Skp family chaperone for outer membrane proteins